MMRHGTIPQRVLRRLRQRGFLKIDQALDIAGRDQVRRAMRRLEQEGLAEQVSPRVWRALRTRAPRLTYSRTWSNPRGVADDVTIAATLADPRFTDLADLCLVYGLKQVNSVLMDMEVHGDLPQTMIEQDRHMLANIEIGFRREAERVAA